MILVLLFLATFGAQAVLVVPGAPAWAGSVLLPVVWIVWLVMRPRRQNPVFLAIALGLVWDVLFEPVIGPGGIAFSAAVLVISWLAVHVADRSPLAWAGAGGAATAVILLVRHVALLPLGLAGRLVVVPFFRSVLLTGGWCLVVGWILSADLGRWWRRLRTRRLR
ncbi:MAG: hypothetical protein GXP48_09650 [Acidobacteria bacterium]|nr:hypothetical protein [Acidobacteriota bacterium]